MLPTQTSTTLTTLEERERRIQELAETLLPRLQQAARQMAEALVDLPDQQLLGDIESTLRDQAHQLASAVHQTGLQSRKKGATRGPAWSVRSANKTAASRATGPALS